MMKLPRHQKSCTIQETKWVVHDGFSIFCTKQTHSDTCNENSYRTRIVLHLVQFLHTYHNSTRVKDRCLSSDKVVCYSWNNVATPATIIIVKLFGIDLYYLYVLLIIKCYKPNKQMWCVFQCCCAMDFWCC